jgi:hypothetical protein
VVAAEAVAMKKGLVTLTALVLFAGLLTWVLTKERGRVAEKEEVFRGDIAREADLVKLEVAKYENTPLAADPKAPGKMTSQRKQTLNLAFERRGDDWFITAPIQGQADPDQMKTMVKSIVELKPSVRKDEKTDVKEYGLAEPTMEVTLGLKGGSQVKIAVGANTPVGGKMYATISGKQGLFMVPTSFRTDLDKQPDSVRDKRLARFEKDKVTRVTFTNAAGSVVAEKSVKGESKVVWTITNPGPYKGDEWAITSGLNKIADTDAKEFAPNPGDLKAYGLDKPRAQCKIETKDGKSYEVLVGAKTRKKVATSEYSGGAEEKDLVYTMRQGRPEVLLMEASLFDDLNKDLFALRDKHIVDFKREDVLSLKVERKAGLAFSVQRAGSDWMIETPQTAKAQKSKVDDIIWDITDLESKEYVSGTPDLKAMGLAVPATVMTVRLKGGKTVTLKFGDEVKVGTEALYYCQSSDSSQVYKVGQLAMKDLPAKYEDLKEGAASTPPSGTLNAVPPPAPVAPQ